MIPDIPELRAFADGAFQFALDRLRERGGLHPMFQVLSQSGIDVISTEAFPQDVPTAVLAELVCQFVRDVVKQKQAYAVCNMGEAWIMSINEAHPLRSLAMSGKYNTADLVRMGVGKRREALVITLETPIYQRVILQHFYRNSDGNVILRDLKDSDSTTPGFGRGQGRFFNFFEQQEPVHG